jgi:hypothetical protein
MTIELKIKAKHLALEPAIIRLEEKRLKARIRYLKLKEKDTAALSTKLNSLNLHRRFDVKFAARATHLARTYLAGKPYNYAEKKRKPEKEQKFQNIVIPRITAMVKKYGDDSQRLIEDSAIRTWAK